MSVKRTSTASRGRAVSPVSDYLKGFTLFHPQDSEVYCIAYGSNLNEERMKKRCPKAEPFGTSVIHGYRLLFKQRMTGAYATIEQDANCCVPVLIYKMTADDEQKLDRFEGYPSYYYKQDMAVTMTDLDGKNPQEITAIVYLMNDGHPIRTPMKGYYDTLEEGYTRVGFNTHLLELAFEEAMEVEHDLC